jgi:hypothetical protein
MLLAHQGSCWRLSARGGWKGKSLYLSQFANEVLARGPEALLPQNLSSRWLSVLQDLVDDFLDSNYELGQCKTLQDNADPILTACVSEILKDQRNDQDATSISLEDLLHKITLYGLAITMESVRRETGIAYSLPTLANLFDPLRFLELAGSYPELGPFLKKACILND